MKKKLTKYEYDIIKILKENKIIDDDDFLTLSSDDAGFIGDSLVRKGIISHNDLQRAIAQNFDVEIVNELNAFSPPSEIFNDLPYDFAKKHMICPVKQEENSITIAFCNPLQLDLTDELHIILNKDIHAVYADKEIILAAIDKFYLQSKDLNNLQHNEDNNDNDDKTDVCDLLSKEDSSTIIQLLNQILREGIHRNASDIHFEPSEDGLKIRFRIDGILQEHQKISLEQQNPLLTRVKVISKLDIAERRLPQDGRIKLKMGGREIDFRVSTVPVIHGERIVLRILDKGNIMLGLDKIGMPEKILQKFKQLLKLPEGILLVTGPTGSGKTTTLYSAINEICDSSSNIMTIEDPVEYKIPSIAQIAVRPKINLTFATGLRHILRQDPDIIMVGEIRDKETAEISIQSSLTGHLVFSTLHTNDAPSAITRLSDMSIEPYLISSSLIAVLAQRLVRKICLFCKCEYTPSEKEKQRLGISNDYNGSFYYGSGCKECFNTGYKGRHGIYELMIINESIKQQLALSADSCAIRQIAIENGMEPLISHGAELVKAGITSISEVLRVTRGIGDDL